MSCTQPTNTMLRSGRVLLSDDEPELEDGLGRSVNEDQASVWSMVLSDEDAESLLYREGNNRFMVHLQFSVWEGHALRLLQVCKPLKLAATL